MGCRKLQVLAAALKILISLRPTALPSMPTLVMVKRTELNVLPAVPSETAVPLLETEFTAIEVPSEKRRVPALIVLRVLTGAKR